MEYPPSLYVDWYLRKPNLKRNWSDSKEFYFCIGYLYKSFSISIRWGFVERDRTEEEQERYETTKKFIEELGGSY